jgi:hypothetical protein
MQRFLARYPGELLPRDPQRELVRLYQRAQPIPSRERRRYKSNVRRNGRYLTAEGWVLIVGHDAIITVVRKDRSANGVHPEVAADRIRDWEMYRSGECARKLRHIARSLGTTSLRALARAWEEMDMPHHWRGGYETFGAFCAEALKPETTLT